MQPDWQQRMRQQQQERQRAAMAAAWQQEQERRKRQETRAGAETNAQDPFARLEAQTAELRRAWAAGTLTEQELTARLDELMVQDEQGTWWAVGIQSGAWQRFEGGRWVPGTPPTHAKGTPYAWAATDAASAPHAPPASTLADRAAPRHSLPAILFYSLFYGVAGGLALGTLLLVLFPGLGMGGFWTLAIIIGIIVFCLALRRFRSEVR